MEHKKATILRDEFGKFVFAQGTQEFTVIDTANGRMEIPIGKAQWVCSCGVVNCEQITE
jgi:hypothetical protein